MIKRALLATMIAASLGALAVPGTASADVYVRVAPPEPRAEVAPQHRRGYVWAPGHWDWRQGRYVWVNGHWVRERPGYVYYAPRWIERNGRWYKEREHWNRGGHGDRDRDGIPNRYDRDNDGVPNRFDSNPNNPRRS